MMTQETINNIIKFRDDRNWKKFHNPKDLAISISLEAADVFSYCVLMADACGLDIDEIVQEKMKKGAEPCHLKLSETI